VTAIVDTNGRAEPPSIEIFTSPDSGLIDPVKQMMLASRFTAGRLKGTAVRAMILLAVDVRLPRLSATELVTAARRDLAAHNTDSALAALDIALDSVITHPTDGERAYALLVRGNVESATGREGAARADAAAGLALYDALVARGVDLVPFLRHLADSARSSRKLRPGPGSDMSAPTALGSVSEQPVLVSHPAIHYPPEMEALRVGGTVVVEATLDTSGHVETASARVFASPNHGLDREALRAVQGSVYRPARSDGHAVRTVIRQAVTFVNY
jgi:TonB family protein